MPSNARASARFVGDSCISCSLPEFVVAVVCSQLHALYSGLWGDGRPPSNFVNEYLSTVWFKVCCWPYSEPADMVKPRLFEVTRRRTQLDRKRNHVVGRILHVGSDGRF